MLSDDEIINMIKRWFGTKCPAGIGHGLKSFDACFCKALSLSSFFSLWLLGDASRQVVRPFKWV